MTYTICRGCTIHHYDNCPSCFGFGFHGNGTIVSAIDAVNGNYTSWTPCPECKSTPFGLPYLTDYKMRVLEAVKDDIICDSSHGWVFWPSSWHERGFLDAGDLRVIADEIERRDRELFGD